jgi:D-serine deaminase-like pyridoxal phosphate-dependent protein
MMDSMNLRLFELSTPVVLIDRSRVLANIRGMQDLASSRSVRLRPHVKTHKCPVIAGWQLEAGAVGICCAKVGEAEVFAEAGVEDIRLAYPVSPANAARVCRLQDRACLSVVVDHLAVAEEWSRIMVAAGRRLDVLVKVDVGFHRCGIDAALPGSARFVEAIASLPGLRFVGLLSHAGQAYHGTSDADIREMAVREAASLTAIAEEVRRSGITVEEVSVGSTPTSRHSLGLEGITELRVGNYVFRDRTQVGLGAARLEDCALTVLARVVSKPAADRMVLDCGSKTLSSDAARGFACGPGYGLVLPTPTAEGPDESLVIERLSEEHAVVRATSGTTCLEPGALVRVIPNHACVVVNLADRLILVDGTEVVNAIPVAARGKVA